MVVSNRNLLFQRSIFRCYVSFREGKSYIWHIFGPMFLPESRFCLLRCAFFEIANLTLTKARINMCQNSSMWKTSQLNSLFTTIGGKRRTGPLDFLVYLSNWIISPGRDVFFLKPPPSFLFSFCFPQLVFSFPLRMRWWCETVLETTVSKTNGHSIWLSKKKRSKVIFLPNKSRRKGQLLLLTSQ